MFDFELWKYNAALYFNFVVLCFTLGEKKRYSRFIIVLCFLDVQPAENGRQESHFFQYSSRKRSKTCLITSEDIWTDVSNKSITSLKNTLIHQCTLCLDLHMRRSKAHIAGTELAVSLSTGISRY